MGRWAGLVVLVYANVARADDEPSDPPAVPVQPLSDQVSGERPLDPDAPVVEPEPEPYPIAPSPVADPKQSPEPEVGYPHSIARRPITLSDGAEARVDAAIVHVPGDPDMVLHDSREFLHLVPDVKLASHGFELEGGLDIFVTEVGKPSYVVTEYARPVGGIVAGRYGFTRRSYVGAELDIVKVTDDVTAVAPMLVAATRQHSGGAAIELTGFAGAFAPTDDSNASSLLIGGSARLDLELGTGFAIEPELDVSLAPQREVKAISYGLGLVMSPAPAADVRVKLLHDADNLVLSVGIAGRYLPTKR